MKKQELNCEILSEFYIEVELNGRDLAVLHKALHLLDESEPALCDGCLDAADGLHGMIVDALEHIEEHVEAA